jgi:Domain of unknown function (DUF4145)
VAVSCPSLRGTGGARHVPPTWSLADGSLQDATYQQRSATFAVLPAPLTLGEWSVNLLPTLPEWGPQVFANSFGHKQGPKGDRGERLPEPHEGPPDSDRPHGLCPRCNKQSSFEVLGSLPVTLEGSLAVDRRGFLGMDQIDRVSSLLCRNCNQAVAVVEEQWVGDKPRREWVGGGAVSWHGVHWWPLPYMRLPADIPGPIAGVFGEAATALAAACPRAAAVMARRTLEAIAADKGATKGTLAEQLAQLGNANVLQPTLAAWATEVRLVGNVGAHYDPINEVTLDDARQVLAFAREVLRYVYELPAELERRRTARIP